MVRISQRALRARRCVTLTTRGACASPSRRSSHPWHASFRRSVSQRQAAGYQCRGVGQVPAHGARMPACMPCHVTALPPLRATTDAILTPYRRTAFLRPSRSNRSSTASFAGRSSDTRSCQKRMSTWSCFRMLRGEKHSSRKQPNESHHRSAAVSADQHACYTLAQDTSAHRAVNFSLDRGPRQLLLTYSVSYDSIILYYYIYC